MTSVFSTRHDRHYSPCGNDLGCSNNIIHLFSMSKSFGLAGWRVGYAVYPAWASEEMVKVQDTLPTHACTASQKIALAALEGWSILVCLSAFSSRSVGLVAALERNSCWSRFDVRGAGSPYDWTCSCGTESHQRLQQLGNNSQAASRR